MWWQLNKLSPASWGVEGILSEGMAVVVIPEVDQKAFEAVWQASSSNPTQSGGTWREAARHLTVQVKASRYDSYGPGSVEVV
jgi:hypothetical protein